uniref:Effector protein n=1 Tax=Fusarium oxysporum f. sp. apii TaxID=224912 RepID=A0A866WKB8_FUSOX|nr:effector protein [Fusarium oxysporum f. sp. apii]
MEHLGIATNSSTPNSLYGQQILRFRCDTRQHRLLYKMHITKFVVAVALPLLAAANEHVGCKCNTGDATCLEVACNSYSAAGVFFNKPKGHENSVFSQTQDGKCYAVYNNGQEYLTFKGLGGKEWLQQCEAHCGGGSTC